MGSTGPKYQPPKRRVPKIVKVTSTDRKKLTEKSIEDSLEKTFRRARK